jgi:hypothetical protein
MMKLPRRRFRHLAAASALVWSLLPTVESLPAKFFLSITNLLRSRLGHRCTKDKQSKKMPGGKTIAAVGRARRIDNDIAVMGRIAG